MRRITTHRLGIDQGSQVLFSDFEHDGEMWTGTGARVFRQAVTFGDVFATPPVVQVSLSMWDLDRKTNQRMDIAAEHVTETGFDIVFRTWGDTRVARVRADWTAFGAVRDEDDWDLY